MVDILLALKDGALEVPSDIELTLLRARIRDEIV